MSYKCALQKRLEAHSARSFYLLAMRQSSMSRLTAGTNITITPLRGSLSIAASGGAGANPNVITDDTRFRTALGSGALGRTAAGV